MRRTPELDGLRGLAALIIAIYHLRPGEMRVGWPKVDLFFVLSGYLITTIILRHGVAANFHGTFFARRALRTWPAYFAALAAVVAINPFLPTPCRMDALPHFLTFTQNVPLYWSRSNPQFQLYFLHTWSMAVEEQFYLVWPLLVGLAGRRYLPALCGMLLGLSVTARSVGFHPWLLVARCDGFAFGGLLAAIFFDPAILDARRRVLSRGFAAAAAGGFGFLVVGMIVLGGDAFIRPDIAWPGLSLLATNLLDFGLVGLILCHSGHPALGILRGRVFAGLGRLSYGMFIFHPLAFAGTVAVYRLVGTGEPHWLDPIKLAASLLVAHVSWTCFERRFVALKSRFLYQPSAAPPPRAALPVRAEPVPRI